MFRILIALQLLGPGVLLAQTGKPDPKDQAAPLNMEAVLARNTVVSKDVAFGTDDKQKLDIYAPQGIQGAPILLFIHGGEWTKGDKAEVSTKPKFFNENGVIFASTNYRLTPPHKHPAHVSDVATAIRWLVDNIAKHGGDPKKIVIMGHSVGCHLVTLVSLDPRYLAAVKLAPKDLAGVVAWSGGNFDLVKKAKSDEKYLAYIRNTFGDDEAAWRDGSPMAHVTDCKSLPPFLFAYVTPNNDSHKATEALAQAITDAKGRAKLIHLENRTHRTANHSVGAADDVTGAQLLEFVKQSTK